MAKTGEGVVKDFVRKHLIQHGLIPSGKADQVTEQHKGWFHMPVPLPMGVMGQPDFHGEYRGRFFGIETKIPGKDPTPLQKIQIKAINTTGGICFVVREPADLQWFDEWVWRIDAEIEILNNRL